MIACLTLGNVLVLTRGVSNCCLAMQISAVVFLSPLLGNFLTTSLLWTLQEAAYAVDWALENLIRPDDHVTLLYVAKSGGELWLFERNELVVCVAYCVLISRTSSDLRRRSGTCYLHRQSVLQGLRKQWTNTHCLLLFCLMKQPITDACSSAECSFTGCTSLLLKSCNLLCYSSVTPVLMLLLKPTKELLDGAKFRRWCQSFEQLASDKGY